MTFKSGIKIIKYLFLFYNTLYNSNKSIQLVHNFCIKHKITTITVLKIFWLKYKRSNINFEESQKNPETNQC